MPKKPPQVTRPPPSAIDNCYQQALIKPFGLPGSQAAGVSAALLGEPEIFPLLGMFPATPVQFACVLSFYSGVTRNNLSSPCLPHSDSYGGVNPQPGYLIDSDSPVQYRLF